MAPFEPHAIAYASAHKACFTILGDERQARKLKQHTRYRAAIRANRQLANTLRDQGLHEEADQFAYRAQRLKREVIAWQMLLLPSQKPEYRWMLRLLLRLHRKNAGRLTVLLLLLVLVINLVICAALLVVQALGQPIIIVALTAIALMLFFTFCFVLLTPTLQLFFLIVVQLTLLLLAQILLILGLLIVFQASLFPLIQPLINAPGLAQVLIVLILIFLLGACFGIAGYLYQRLSMLQRMVIYVLNTGGHLLRYVGLLLFLLGALVGKWVQYCFALFLDAVSGFGYKPERAVLSYIVVLLSFTSCFI